MRQSQKEKERFLLAVHGLITISEVEAYNSLIFGFENVDKIWPELLRERKEKTRTAFGRQEFITLSESLPEYASFDFGFNPYRGRTSAENTCCLEL